MIPLIFDPIYSQLDLPERHRFPVQKYQALHDRLQTEVAGKACFFRPKPLNATRLKTALCPQYIEHFVSGNLEPSAMRRIGFPWSEQLVKRSLTAAAGTILAGEFSLTQGRAFNLTGGYHHAFFDQGSGFCILNDLYLSALNLLDKPGIQRVLIFDCDVHQGDGTAKLAAERDDIITVSIHGEKNFPFRKQRSDIDVALPKWTGDEAYLEQLEKTLNLALTRYKPDAVIYDAGADIHIDDDLGHFDVSTEGVFRRDQLVFTRCEQAGLPVSAVIGGGYQRDIKALVDVHYQLFRAGLAL